MEELHCLLKTYMSKELVKVNTFKQFFGHKNVSTLNYLGDRTHSETCLTERVNFGHSTFVVDR